jgi:hypothetical protein
MKSLSCIWALSLISTVFSGIARGQFADEPKQYSYQMVTNSKDGHSTTMMMYVDGDKRRVDTEMGAKHAILIYRGDQGKSYVLLPEQKSYLESPLNPQLLQRFKNPLEFAKQRGGVFEKVGTEELNGEPCDKYSWSYARPSVKDPNKPSTNPKVPLLPNDRSTTPSGTTWISQKTHLPVKSQTERFTMETKDAKLGPPDATLFEVPSDFKKINGGR